MPLHCIKNVVNIDSVTLEFKKAVCGIFAPTGQRFDDRRVFGTLAFRNGLEYYNFDFRRVSAIVFLYKLLCMDHTIRSKKTASMHSVHAVWGNIGGLGN